MAQIIVVSEEVRIDILGGAQVIVLTSQEQLDELGITDDEFEKMQEFAEDYDCGGDPDVWVDRLQGHFLTMYRAEKNNEN